MTSPYLTSVRYLDKELFVDTDQINETEFPVLLMDWVEGKTLDKYLRENLDDKYALEMLAYRFSQLAQWLIPQPFAHGDLKPDNILVREDGTLVLVDYDGMYVPAMKGQKARELGSPDFRHPLRTENDFDEHIDDFPLVSILLSLKAISINPLLFNKYGTTNRLLFSERDYRCINDSVIVLEISSLMSEEDSRSIMAMFILCLTSKRLNSTSTPLLNVYFEGMDSPFCNTLPEELRKTIQKAILGGKVEQNSLGYIFYYGEGLCQNYSKALYWYRASASHYYPKAFYNLGICYQNGTGVKQSYGEALKWFLKAAENGDVDAQFNLGIYYRYGRAGMGSDLHKAFCWLLKAAEQGNSSAQCHVGGFYQYGKGCVEINNQEAFRWYKLSAEQGDKYGQYHLAKCYWDGIVVEKDYNEALKWFELSAKQGHEKAQKEFEKWGIYWFDRDKALYSKDKKSFLGLWSLYTSEYEILEGAETIADYALCDLGSEIDYSYLGRIVIPSSVKTIGHSPFNKYLLEIMCYSPFFEVDNNTIYSKGKERLIQCFAKTEEFVVPNEVEFIDDHAFYGCKSKKIIISKSVKRMGINPFIEMDKDGDTLEIISYSSKFVIDNNTLYEDSHKLISYWGNYDTFTVPKGIKEIGEFAFFNSKLKTINIPDTIESIGDCAFGWCFSLEHVLAPSSSAGKFKRIMDEYQDMIRIEGE